jgi:hypothetical protein
LKKKDFLSRWHVCFKPSSIMPTTTLLDLSPNWAMAKSGNLTLFGLSTTTSVTSFSTNSIKDIFQDDSALLATLQERKIHAPPGPCQAYAGVCSTTKTQLQAERNAAKNSKAKAIKERKFAVAACKTNAVINKRMPHFLHRGQGGQGRIQG